MKHRLLVLPSRLPAWFCLRWLGIGIGFWPLAALAQPTYEPYTFTTLAGSAGYGSTDGIGKAVRFNKPSGVAVDHAGNVYVADTDNSTVRKVTPLGMVMTPAGQAGSPGFVNGTGPAARFNEPYGVAVDDVGNVYVADRRNQALRKMTPAGLVTTLVYRFIEAGTYS